MTSQEYFDNEKLKLPIRAQQALEVINVSCAELLLIDNWGMYIKYGRYNIAAIKELLNDIRIKIYDGMFDDSLSPSDVANQNERKRLYYEANKSKLSARAQAVLSDLQVPFPEILKLTKRDVFRFRNCGQKSAKEILKFIAEINEKFPQEEESIHEDSEVKDYIFDQSINSLSVRANHVIKINNISSRKQLYEFLYEKKEVRNYGERTKRELFNFHNQLLCDELANKDDEIRRVTLYGLYKARNAPTVTEVIETIFIRVLKLLDTSSRDIIKKYYQSSKDVFQKNIRVELLHDNVPENSQIQKDVLTFRETFFERVEDVLLQDDTELKLYDDFTYLSPEEKQFVLSFKESNNHLPLFFLMQEAIRHVYIKNEYTYEIYSQIFNIIDERFKGSHRKIHTYERVKKIDSLYHHLSTKYSGYVTSPAYSHLINNSVLTVDNSDYDNIKKEERLNMDFRAFCFLSAALLPQFKLLDFQILNDKLCPTPFCCSSNGEYIYSFAINNSLDSFKFAETIADIWAICNQKRILENVEINLYPKYFMNQDMWESEKIEYTQIDSISEVLHIILQEILGGVKVENGILYVRANGIDKKRFFYEYLSAQKRPISVSEMMQVFNARYPEWAMPNDKQAKYYLSDKSLFKPIGKTSIYVLKNSDVFTGNIKDAIRQVMDILNSAVKKDTIIAEVMKLRPDSTPKSIRTNITFMVKEGILEIQEDGLYVLKNNLLFIDDALI